MTRPAPSLRRALLWGAAIGGGLGLVPGIWIVFILPWATETPDLYDSPRAVLGALAILAVTVFFGALLGAIVGSLVCGLRLAWWWYVGLVALVVVLIGVGFYDVAGVLLGVLVVGALVRLIRQWRRRAR